MSYITPTYCKNILHKRHGQLGFHFLILFLKHGKWLESFMFCGIKAQTFGDKKDIVSVPHLAVLRFLTNNSLRIIKSYGIASLKLHLILLEISHVGIYKFQLLNFEHFFDESYRSHPYQGT